MKSGSTAVVNAQLKFQMTGPLIKLVCVTFLTGLHSADLDDNLTKILCQKILREDTRRRRRGSSWRGRSFSGGRMSHITIFMRYATHNVPSSVQHICIWINFYVICHIEVAIST